MGDFEGVQSYLIGAYQFELREDYEAAMQEKKGVEYLNSQTDYKNIGKVYTMYCELVQRKIFYTPVGLDYLRKLRTTIVNSGQYERNQIPSLYVPSGKKRDSARVERYISTKYKDKVTDLDKKVDKMKNRCRTSIILNIIMVVMIIAMFAILTTSTNPNILNYERVLQDKYASWSEDLKEKEAELRAWERELEELQEELNGHSQN